MFDYFKPLRVGIVCCSSELRPPKAKHCAGFAYDTAKILVAMDQLIMAHIFKNSLASLQEYFILEKRIRKKPMSR
jgi:hypothetical protein